MKTNILYCLIIVFIVVQIGILAFSQRAFPKAEVVPQLPPSFTVKERFPTWGDHVFDMYDGDRSYGRVNQDLLSVGKKFIYLDNSDHQVASAHAAVLSWPKRIDVYDADGNQLGVIKEEMFSSLLSLGITNKYSILDNKGNKVAESEKFQVLATQFTIRDNAGNTVATLKRPAWNLGGHVWTVDTDSKSEVDSRLLVMIAAFKTAEDNENDD